MRSLNEVDILNVCLVYTLINYNTILFILSFRVGFTEGVFRCFEHITYRLLTGSQSIRAAEKQRRYRARHNTDRERRERYLKKEEQKYREDIAFSQ